MPSLTISSHPDAKILLIGGDLKVERRGVGTLTADIPPGFYKVKAERGGGTVEQLIELNKDRYINLPVYSFPAIAPLAPLLRGDTSKIETLGYQVIAAPLPPWSEQLGPYLGDSGEPGLLILAHSALTDEGDSLAGLRLMPWNGHEAADLIAMGKVDTIDERWAAVWLPLRPACYLLQVTDGRQKVLQAVPISPGWQTRVFLRRRKWLPRLTPLPDASQRRDWIDVSIQYARPNAEIVYFDHLETVEVARNALELTRTNFVSGDLIDALLSEKFNNPVAGIAGLHLFLEALERDRFSESAVAGREVQIDNATRARAPDIIRIGLGNLERLFGPESSYGPGVPTDLIALKLRAGLAPSDRTVVHEPPIFWVSWDVLRRNSDVKQPIEVSIDLWRRIAFASAWGPYLAWPPRETSVEEFVESQLRSSAGEPGFASLGIDGSTGRVLGNTDVAQSESVPPMPMLDGAELANALGIPLSVAVPSRKRGA